MKLPGLESIEVTIKGVGAIITHNGRLADPHYWANVEMKPLTSQKNKTMDTHAKISLIEWEGGLYLNDDGKVCIPADVLKSCIESGAKESKRGKLCKAGVYVTEPAEFRADGVGTVEEMRVNPALRDVRMVVVNGKRVPRTRPIFNNWSATFTIDYDPSIMNREHVIAALREAGRLHGLGDLRPTYGRFVVEKIS